MAAVNGLRSPYSQLRRHMQGPVTFQNSCLPQTPSQMILQEGH